ncbi:MAG: LytTR family transcriptional regulator, partial [Clostridia bacterium]|nr:LytTR family transcriptional regulator [Clostridia bacterium]
MNNMVGLVERFYLPNKAILTKDSEFICIKDVVYLTSKKNSVFAVLAGKKPIELPGNLNAWEKLLRGLFVQTHRQYLVALDRIEGTFERFPEEPEEEKRLTRAELRAKDDECEISLRGTAKRIPVTAFYGQKLKKTLGITRFHYLAPENPSDRALRLYGLIDFGWRELYTLDQKDKAAVAAFKVKWDIKQFDKRRMLSYFRLYGANEINTKRV